VVAIDGPAGAGKSTVARRLALALGLPYVNTGLMYRALAARALAQGVSPDDAEELARLAERMSFSLGGGPPPEVLLDGAAPSPVLGSSEVEAVVSRVARHPSVRAILRARQRSLGSAGAVMEGRDIGTVVFPDADVKIFLSASLDARTGRRQRERGGDRAAAAAVARRDAIDSRTNPLVPAPDAHVLDTTALSPEEVYAAALRLVSSAGVHPSAGKAAAGRGRSPRGGPAAGGAQGPRGGPAAGAALRGEGPKDEAPGSRGEGPKDEAPGSRGEGPATLG
jgi:cytidylate kinase